MKNREIADIFERIADLLEILGEQPFRVNSYRKSARVIGDLSEAIEDVAAEGRLQQIAGVGKSTAEKIQQCLETGKVELLEDLLTKVPPRLPDLLAVAGLGPKTVAKLWRQGKVTSLDELKAALEGGADRLTSIEGLGARKVQQIKESLAFLESTGGRIDLGQADELARGLIAVLRGSKAAGRVSAAGSLRRGRETIGDIDILAEAGGKRAEKLIDAYAANPAATKVLAKGPTKCFVMLDSGVEADLRVVAPKSFGAALAYFTGSKDHNIRMRELAIKAGMKLNEYGLFAGDRQVAGRDEEGIYEALDLAFVAPELREDRGEVEAAARGALPGLVELKDIRGDLHMHTTASDGLNTLAEMIDACRERGYRYMVIADHSKSQIQANGLDEKRLAAEVEDIRKAGRKHKDILVLAGVEVDIFKDGRLDFEADVLAELDFVTASPHTALTLGRAEATRRLIRAIEHPHVHCIGHATGRLINSRGGMEIDIDEVAAAAAANNVALEINAHPWRLDLRDIHVRAAVKAGAKLVINTDAHDVAGLDLMRFGVMTARRGWAGPKDVINTYTVKRLQKWIADR
jgi:DNA polymerase (family 10)